jgi:hydroxymethylglutaryl-CoA reductase
MSEKNSRISGFYKMSIEERIEKLKEFADLDEKETEQLNSLLNPDVADRFIENVVGVYQIPLGVAVNFLINEKDYVVPMAIEESSVVAAASNAAKLARIKGGFRAKAGKSLMIGQIQLKRVNSLDNAESEIISNRDKILDIANSQDSFLVGIGGGAKDIEVRRVKTAHDTILVVHLLVDVKDAMGANTVNTMAEAVAPYIENLSKGEVGLRIISNLADKRVTYAEAIFDREAIGGEKVVDGIIDAYEFADADPYRAATHNKGIMNGIDPVVIATGNDFRAIEAGAHSYASRGGRYRSLTSWSKDKDGNLKGEIKVPLALGTVGGLTKLHPGAKLCLKILGVKSSGELAEVAASLGLAQNFAALKALATEGIQRGHMKLHAKNIAMMVGAEGSLIDEVARRMIEKSKINLDFAKKILEELS